MSSTWYTVDDDVEGAVERVSAAWIDAPIENLETCGFILAIARDQVWSFASESEDDDGEPVDVPTNGDDVPERLVYAQLQQAINLYNAGRVSSAGEVGAEGFTYTPRPLDKTIRLIITPISGVFNVG